MLGFERKKSFDSVINSGTIGLLGTNLKPEEVDRVERIKESWDYYRGYHWENMPDEDSAEITINYCRAFVDKFVSFELGKLFSFTVHKDMADKIVTADGRTLFEYLEDVWEDNKQYQLTNEIGQMKSVTGEAWIQVRYFTPEEIAPMDPYSEYEDGRLRLILMPTHTIFPEYDPFDRERLVKLTVIYPYTRTVKSPILGRDKEEKGIFKQVWTDTTCVTQIGKEAPIEIENRYGVIPFVCIKNLPIAGFTEGRSDIEDLIPLNTEFNLKSSNISEILDYHAAPVTLVYGAKVNNLEKGANKVWGGLPKDAKVENLSLNSDLVSSTNYMSNIKLSMCEVAGIPETVLGGAQSISNTSGVALQYMNLPLVEKTRLKRANTETGLETLNKLILLISSLEGLIFKPSDVPLRDFLHTEVTLPDTLPKDTLLELQQIEIEMRLGLEDRYGAMQRLGKEDIETLIARIDADREEHPELYGSMDGGRLNSGFTNGQTQQEEVNKEINGENKEETV